jgi:predicted RNA-binding protein
MIKTTFAALFAFLLIGCAQSEEKVVVKKEYYAKPVREVKLENFHKVDEKIYRSAICYEACSDKLYSEDPKYMIVISNVSEGTPCNILLSV